MRVTGNMIPFGRTWWTEVTVRDFGTYHHHLVTTQSPVGVFS